MQMLHCPVPKAEGWRSKSPYSPVRKRDCNSNQFSVQCQGGLYCIWFTVQFKKWVRFSVWTLNHKPKPVGLVIFTTFCNLIISFCNIDMWMRNMLSVRSTLALRVRTNWKQTFRILSVVSSSSQLFQVKRLRFSWYKLMQFSYLFYLG